MTLDEWRVKNPEVSGRPMMDLVAVAEHLAEEVNRQVKLRDEMRQERDEARNIQRTTEKESILIHQQFADLKNRLHQSEMFRARQTGYIDRVAEDDHARDGFFKVKTPDGAEVRPRRPNEAKMLGAMEEAPTNFVEKDLSQRYNRIAGEAVSRRRPVHWVNY